MGNFTKGQSNSYTAGSMQIDNFDGIKVKEKGELIMLDF
jgi:hypothetical protein